MNVQAPMALVIEHEGKCYAVKLSKVECEKVLNFVAYHLHDGEIQIIEPALEGVSIDFETYD